MRPRLIALVGPTAGGKTSLAIGLARAIDAEIVSIDSRQVYRYLDVGTAKPDHAARALVRHHLLDVVDPDVTLDAARFAALGRAAIADALARGVRVVLCGGSGLYLRALTEGLCPAPPADPEVRARLHAIAQAQGAVALHAMLERLDPTAARRIEPRDVQRTIRALEVLELTGRPLSEWQARHAFADRPYDLATFVLSPESDDLERRIAERTRAMWQGGLLEETERVLGLGFSPELPPLRAIGYREAIRHLAGELEREAAIAAMIRATRQYAKRQRTWFRGLGGARWLDAAGHDASVLQALFARSREFLDEAHLS